MNWLLYIRFGLLLVFLLPQISSGQSNLNNGDTATADTAKVTNIELIHADALEYDETTGIKAKKLIGNVHFLHDGTHMYCDSAYLFTDENSMRAYSNVRIDGSSGAKITGDSLRYNGNTKVAKMRGDIKLLDENQELTTNYLDFKIKEDLAYYLGGGVLINKEEKSTLISEVGYYYTKRKEFFFKDSVKMTHPDYEIISDTLMHNTKSERTFFNGPSTITTKESTIYCEDGWYDAKADSSILKGNAVIDNKGQLMYGDSIFYSRKNGIGEAFCNIHIIDTTEKMEIFGDYAIHYEKDSISIVTGDNALLIQEYDDDTLYLHGDTLISTFEGIPIDTLALVNDSLSKDSLPLGSDSISKLTPDLVSDTLKQNFDDSLGLKIDTLYDKNDSLANADTVKASKFRVIRAFHKVKFLKKDMQGKCDSLVFSDIDSTIQMHIKPIIWTDENQLSGDFIRILLYKGEPKRFDMNSNSFIISEVDSISKKYNQIKGQNMIGFFKKGALKKVNVKGNGMSIYYAVEKSKKTENDSVKIREESYIGMNRADGEDMDLYIDDNKVKKIVIKKPSPSTLFPLEELKKDDLKLPGFKWRDAERPKKWDDIFYWEEENSNLLGISKNEENEIETLEAQENAKDEVKTSEKSQ